MKTKSMTIDGQEVTPTHQAFSRAGFDSVDAFRTHLKRYPNAAKPIKIGQANFHLNRELDALKRERDAVRKAK